MNNKETLKQFAVFLGLCMYFLGTLAGIGYTIYNDAWPVTIGIIVTAGMAFPTARRWWDILNFKD